MSVVVDCTMDTALKNIVILATGGTIAGAGEQGKDIGYKSGSIKAQTLIDAIPELKNVANIFVEQVCNINSDDITSEIWISIALRIKELFENGFGDSHELVDGIVIMHGTDTMEETAFFLSLVLNVAKPVILTGSMRPATAAEPDGPANLLFAVKCAVEQSLQRPERAEGTILSNAEGSSDSPVRIAFAGKLMDSRTVQKIHANDLDAFAEIGTAQSSRPTFDISSLRSLPKVTVLYFNADADADLVRYAAERSAGLVIAGAGAGEFSQSWMNAIGDVVAKSNVPVVISTRINRGSIVPEQLLVPGTIAAYSLPPAKAAVLLRLALTITNDPAAIQKFYQRYT
ncbi:L-asparaginase [Fibrobacter sp. UWB11]|nr:L-asparaginase [Fibrobacter sp. UWB11]